MALRLVFGRISSRLMSSIMQANATVTKGFQMNFSTLRNASFWGVQNVSCNLLSPLSPVLTSARGFKIKGRLKRRCKDCYFVMRQDRLYVMCKTHPRHKQMAIKPPEKKTWILTHATQGKIRPW